MSAKASVRDETTAEGRAVSLGLIVAVVLVAANLRATLTGVGPLLPAIEQGSGLSPQWGGLLTTLPLLTFAATSPLVGRISHRLGTSRLLVLSLIVLAAGTVLRSLPSVAFLFIGTVVLSAAIACGNVLLPAVIRRSVPGPRIGAVSAMYVTVMGLVAAVSSGVSVPLAQVLPGGWRTSLAWGAVLIVLALAVWIPRLRGDTAQAGPAAPRGATPWRSWLAWQVSLFMGLQSLAFYVTIAWLPSILVHQGVSAAEAGWMLFFYQVVGLVSSGFLPLLTRGRHDQRWAAVAASASNAAGFVVLLISPELALLSCVLLGLGGGACLVLALTFQSHRAGSTAQAPALAGMAQSIGYLVAAAGPLLLGILHDRTGGWTVPLIVVICLCVPMVAAGFGAGRDVQINDPHSS
ncbi:MFS transporter [Spongiactinospora gelatinilytica]|uniref:MFS transporter n=1 Tax=Spongiactinospora gelatinilytica TaxID=2666298 RepID=A0A2W2GUG7_9ACTN|nr:MFS transporter [Spongiactinospora gelatinilytica]PZG43675.1 MFS transporter [Spongiactinospora gelatinilytica]